MKRLTQTLPLLLAAALQLLPLLRNIVTAPAASSSFAIVLRWTIGSSAALGAYDAYSAATTPYFVSPTNYYGTVGIYFTNNIIITNTQDAPGAFFILYNANFTVISGHISNNVVTTNCMPTGLSFKCIDLAPTKQIIIGSIYGTPINPVTNLFAHFQGGYPGASPVDTTNYFTISSVVSGSPPIITNQPVSVTNVAGGNASFTVLAGGVPSPAYQWKFNGSTVLPNATNSSLMLTNIRASQTGTYSVTITNAGGATNSLLATLVVTNPLPTTITAATNNGGVFKLTFIPTVGLTNSVQTNSVLAGGSWVALTNVPPPVTASPVTVTDALGNSNRFYRVQIIP